MAIRIVVVGMGQRGQQWLREIHKAPGYEPVARVDIDPAALREVSNKGAVTSNQWPLKIRDSNVQIDPVAKKSTGQHASEGFCIYRGSDNNVSSGVLNAKDLGRLITQGFG